MIKYGTLESITVKRQYKATFGANLPSKNDDSLITKLIYGGNIENRK